MNPIVVLLALAGFAGGIIALRGKNTASFFKGQTRNIIFRDGSKPEHASRLRLLFENVIDKGNGVYQVTSNFDGNVSLPEGATIGAVSSITLYAGFYKGKHVGFAFGAGPAYVINKAYTPITFVRSSQSYPTRWAPQWKPVYGDSAHRTQWGKFLEPYDSVVANQLRGEGYTAYYVPNKFVKPTHEWAKLALR